MTEQEATSLLKQRDGGEEMGMEWEWNGKVVLFKYGDHHQSSPYFLSLVKGSLKHNPTRSIYFTA